MGRSKQTTVQESKPYDGLPSWALEYFRDDAALAGDLTDDATSVAQFLAENPRIIEGMSPDEIAAVQGVMGEAENARGLLDDARDAAGGGRQMAGYTDEVVNTTLASMQRDADRRRSLRAGQEAAIGGPSSTRMGVADAVSGSLDGMNMAQAEAEMRDSGYRFGSQQGLAESRALSDLAQRGMGIAGTEAQFRGVYGETERKLRQQQRDAVRSAPQEATDWLSSVFARNRQLPSPGGGSTTTTAPGPSRLGQALGTAASVASIWAGLPTSDERAKENIEGVDDALSKLRGLHGYEYDYKAGLGHTEARTSGLMAQDLEQSGIKGAVMMGDDGLRRVDPYPVLATVVQAIGELDRKMEEAGLGNG